ncbi:MAG: DUF1569 domain-containing protein [Longimicrobiales bacterium]|nr:DUF1569 domain-containing protein [Longimicrobiales bacterium]
MMRTIGDPRVLAQLQARVRTLTPDSPRKWGKMNVQQMLSHIGGAMEWVLEGGEARMWESPMNPFLKFIAFRVPLPWPRGIPNPNDPAGVDVPAAEFEALQRRVLEALEAMGTWEVSQETPPHPAFGPLTTWEWKRWAFKHADHHLKQFSA